MPEWDSDGSDWDAAASEHGVRHEGNANADWAGDSVLELGYPSYDEFGQGNLTHYYPLDEASGGNTAFDVAGDADGTNINDPTLGEAGVLGSTCYYFDGGNAHIDCGTQIIPMTSDFTCAAWVNVDAGATADDIWISNSDSGTFYWYTVTGFGSADNSMRVWDNGVGEIVYSDVDLRGTGWRHIALTRGGDSWTLYLDGGVEDTATQGDLGGSRNTYIGQGQGVRRFQGYVDEARIYDYELTQQQIQWLHDPPTSNGGSLITAGKVA